MTNPGQAPERTAAPGTVEWNRMQAAGFSAPELQEWKANERASQQRAGFTPQEISDYWGERPDVSSSANGYVMRNLAKAKAAVNPWEAVQAGFGMTAIGLGLNKGKPDYIVPKDAKLGDQIFAGIGQLTGDLPVSIAGFLVGAPAGGAAGAAVTGPAAPVGVPIGALAGGGFGAGAAPVAAREAVLAAYDADDIDTAEEFWGRVGQSTIAALKGGAIGLVTTPLGGVVGGKAAALGANRLIAGTADVTTQAVGATAMGGAMEGRMPDRDEFAAAVVLGLGTHLVTPPGRGKPARPTDGGRYAEQGMKEVFRETGAHPQNAARAAQVDPVLQDEIIQQDVHGDPVIPKYRKNAPQPVEPFQPSSAGEGTAKPADPAKAVEDTLDVIRGHEGFKPTAYWDVNAWRTGYGSDTITHPDGSFEKVTKDTTVTREDAERDLARRYRDDFEPRARRAVGEAWHALDPDTQAALVSVTYNYGSLPENIVRAARTGDAEKIAQAIEARQFDNDGVNKGRRLQEAKMARGGGGGEKPPGGGEGGGSGGKEVVPFGRRGTLAEIEPPTVKGERTDWGTKSTEERYAAAGDMVGTIDHDSVLDLVDPDRLIDQYVSELRPARVIDQEIFKAHPELNKSTTYGIEDAYRNTYASDDRAGLMMSHGPIDGRTNQFIEGGPSLKGAVAKLKKAGGNIADWKLFMLAARTVEKAGQNIPTGMDPELAHAIVNQKGEMAKYKEAVAEFQKTGWGVLQYAVDKGRYSPEQARRMVSKNLFWVSMRRVQGDHEAFAPARRGNFKVGRGIRTMEGSDKQVVDPIMASIDNWRMIVADADRNEAAGVVVGAAEGGLIPSEWGVRMIGEMKEDPNASKELAPYAGVGHNGGPELDALTEALAPDLAIQAFKRDGKSNQFLYFRNGKPEVWQTESEALARLMRGAESPGEMHLILAGMQGVAALQRAGITSLPDFALKTTIGDQVGAWMNDPLHPPPIVTLALGIIPALTHNKTWKNWVAAGGAGSSAVAMDRDFLTRDMGRIFEETGAAKRVWNVLQTPYELAAIVQERIDAAQRIGYQIYATKAKGVDPRKSAMMGRKAYVDFKEKATVQLVNTFAKITPFLRPTLLGLKNVGEAIAQRPLDTALHYGIAGAVILGLALLNAQDDEHLPENEKWSNMPHWQRDMYMTTPEIAGIRFKVGTRDALTLVNMTVNRYVDYWKTNDKHSFDHFAGDFFKLLLPNITPTLTKPVAEAAANYSEFSGRALIPASLEGVSGPLQYTDATTPTGKKLAQWLGNVPGAKTLKLDSPIVVDNYIRGYLGTGGIKIAKILNAPDPGTVRPEELADNPFIAGFVHRTAGASAQPISDFYDAYDKVKTAQADLKVSKNRRNMEEFRDARQNMLASVSASQVADTLRQHQIHIQAINKNPDLSVDEKRQETEQLYSRMIVVAKRGLKIIDKRQAQQDAHEARQKAAEAPVPSSSPAPASSAPAPQPVAALAGSLPLA